MSGPRQSAQTRPVYGPRSALSDFLASHNISASEIRRSVRDRNRAAREAEEQATADNGNSNGNGDAAVAGVDQYPAEAADDHETGEDDDSDSGAHRDDEGNEPAGSDPIEIANVPARRTTRATRAAETRAQAQKRKLEEKKAVEKIKASKMFAKRKRLTTSADDDDNDDDDDDDDIAQAIFEEYRAPPPGQMENCAECEKRFTVTPYSRAGPDRRLLCNPCGKQLDKDKPQQPPASKKAKKSSGGVGRQRNIQNRIMDGTFNHGAKSLVTLCAETLAKNVQLAESLGDLPEHQVDRIARLFSKRRLWKPSTLPLFVRPGMTSLAIYDGSYLGEHDFRSFLQVGNSLKRVRIRNAIQFKDTVMEYLLDRQVSLEEFYIHGANLLSDDMWKKFLHQKGASLQSLRVYWTDRHFGDDMIDCVKEHCPNLTRLKIYHNQRLTGDGIEKLAGLQGLRHLGLHTVNVAPSKSYALAIGAVGHDLETLSLRDVPNVGDDVLDTIRTSCGDLKKLQITDSTLMTDGAFARLFTDWNVPSLQAVNFSNCRHLDASDPTENPTRIGFCSDGFLALMRHSQRHLNRLNVHGCRHISEAALEAAFKPGTTYPELCHLEVSFVEQVTTLIVTYMFKACPNLRTLNVLGCMRVRDRDLKIPRGVNMVGGSNAWGSVFENGGAGVGTD